MKHIFKKSLSLLLALLMLFGITSVAFADEEISVLEDETFSDMSTPVVYVAGQESIIYSDKNDINSQTYLTDSLPDDTLVSIAQSVTSQLTTGIVTGEWDDFCDALYDAITPYFSPIKLDKNGNATNTTGYDCLKEKTVDKAIDGRYGINDYKFVYDWRLDPCANAAELDAYIKEVKAATGFSKINIIARGLGYSTLLAYFNQFGTDDIKECIIYNSGLNGVDIVGAVFSGQVSIDSDALNRYLQENLSDTDIILALAQYAADVALTNGFADSLLSLTAKIYAIIYENVLPRILVNTYGTMPGYWSMVSDEYYKAAKKFVFSNLSKSEKTDYTVLTKKADRFHNILNNAKTILEKARKNGVNIYNIAKYGRQLIPLTTKTEITSDGIVALDNSTLGATCSDYDEKLSEEYLSNAKEDGSILYISPDSEVDASTGYLPLHTWYIKNLSHDTFPQQVDLLVSAIFEYDGYTTVFDIEDYSQYLVCNDEADRMENLTATGVIDPTVTEEIEDYFEFDSPTGIVKKIFMLVAQIAEFMRTFISFFIFDT